MLRTIEVVEYDPDWPDWFRRIRTALLPSLESLCVGIEHVGSTSVPGLAAKPIIDIDVVISSRSLFPAVRDALASIGYVHRGNLEIPGREAFERPSGGLPHHLYVCSVDTPNLHNHLVLRDTLRARADLRERYAAVKRQLAVTHRDDVDGYVDAKGPVIEEIMAIGRAAATFEDFQPAESWQSRSDHHGTNG
ncbi:MAG: GrpB family protein [bacterium]